jgi:ABC-type multidrug transport system permease subunit
VLQGVSAVFRKEILHLRKDVFTLVLAFVLPIIQAIGFGSSVGGAARLIPLAVYDEDHQRASRELVADFENSSYFRLRYRVSEAGELERLIRSGKAKAGLHIPPHYSRDLDAGVPTRVQLLVDGVEHQFAASAVSAAGGIESRLAADGAPRRKPVEIAPFLLYATELSPSLFVISGLLALVLTQCGIALASLTLVREKETGSFEQLIVTPITRLALVVGKIVPYAIISAINGVAVVLMSIWIFDFPFRGSPVLFAVLSLLFFVAVLGYGLLISAVATNAVQAVLLALILIFPPIFFSGFDSPFSTLPTPLKAVGLLFPMTFYLDISRGIMVRGVSLGDLWVDVLGLVVQCGVLFSVTAWRFRKTLG